MKKSLLTSGPDLGQQTKKSPLAGKEFSSFHISL